MQSVFLNVKKARGHSLSEPFFLLVCKIMVHLKMDSPLDSMKCDIHHSQLRVTQNGVEVEPRMFHRS